MSAELTGKHRYTAEWRGMFRKRHVLVLQLEERYSEMHLVGGWPDRVEGTRWRDAQVTDLPSAWHTIPEAP